MQQGYLVMLVLEVGHDIPCGLFPRTARGFQQATKRFEQVAADPKPRLARGTEADTYPLVVLLYDLRGPRGKVVEEREIWPAVPWVGGKHRPRAGAEGT